MRRLVPFAALFVIGGLTAAPAPAGDVRVARLTPKTWDDFVPRGKEVDAIYGDLVIRNDHVIAVIAQPKATRNANMTVRSVGGQLIDLTTPASESDQLSAFYVGKRKHPFTEWDVRRLATAGEEVLPTEGDQIVEGGDLAIVVHSPETDSRAGVKVRYRLTADARYLEITTTYTSKTPRSVHLEDDVRMDARNESIRFSPNGVHDVFAAQDRYWGQAYGVVVEGGRVQSTTSRGIVLRYRLGEADGSAKLDEGQPAKVVTRLFPGRDLLEVRANIAAHEGRALQPTTIVVNDGRGRPLADALVSFKRDKQTYGAARTDADGRIVARLPAGGIALNVTTLGVQAGSYNVDVQTGDNEFVFGSAFTPGLVKGTIVDHEDRPLPAKIEFRPTNDGPLPDFGPHSAAGDVGNLVYAAKGSFERTIPPGEYDVIVSRGPEYDALFTKLTVPAGGEATLAAKLPRVVDTTGWVSADFHSHSSPSGDNTGSQLGRVQNLVCEHIEFAPCTEHNRISTYEHHIAALGIGDHIRTVSGMELTGSPLPLNHQNTFPLIHRPRTQDGGGPVTDSSVETQVERIALWDDRSRKLIQQNHPDIGWLFYDANGDGEPDEGHPRILPHIDVMEIHPISAVVGLGPNDIRDGKPRGNNRLFNWLQMLNQGHRIKGVVNTDAHYNFHGSGGLRNWIRSSTDDPAKIDIGEMVENSEAGHLVMSNGPFLEFTVQPANVRSKLFGPGEDVRTINDKVHVTVRVQTPNWILVDRVYLLVNGRVSKQFDFGADAIAEGVVAFEKSAFITLEEDAHLIAVAVGEKTTLGHVPGPSWGRQHPAAITNPVWVDTDGNGFTPNRDTLGVPLPVKYGTRK